MKYRRDDFYNDVLDLANDKYGLDHINFIKELSTLIALICDANLIKEKIETK